MNPICNFCNNTSEHCCNESDKNYEAEQAKRERVSIHAPVWGATAYLVTDSYYN